MALAMLHTVDNWTDLLEHDNGLGVLNTVCTLCTIMRYIPVMAQKDMRLAVSKQKYVYINLCMSLYVSV